MSPPVSVPPGWDDSTSAMSLLRGRQKVQLVLVAGMLSIPGGTSTSSKSRLPPDMVVEGADATRSGERIQAEPPQAAAETRQSARHALAELRRLGGLTWEQVARLFGVSRRSVHFWASGKPMSSEHEEALHRLLAIFRDAGQSADSLRAKLLTVVDGHQVLDLLAQRRFEEASAALGRDGAPHKVRPRKALSVAAEKARQPLPPEYLAAGEEPSAHPVKGRGRAVRTARSEGRG